MGESTGSSPRAPAPVQVIGGLLGVFAMEEEESHSRTAEGPEGKGTPSPSVKPKEGWGAA